MRSKKMVILSHCILNVNSKVEGFEPYSAMIKDLLDFLNEQNFGIIQLPCPELLLMGMRRWGVVKEQLMHPHAILEMQNMILPIIQQIQMYHDLDYKIYCIIGIDGSPSCGVNITCSSDSWRGEFSSIKNYKKFFSNLTIKNEKGIFMQILEKEILAINEDIPFLAINEENMTDSLQDIKQQLKKLSQKFN